MPDPCPDCGAPLSTDSSPLGACEPCHRYRCARCRAWVSWDQGAADDLPGVCDDCWSALHDDDGILILPAGRPYTDPSCCDRCGAWYVHESNCPRRDEHPTGRVRKVSAPVSAPAACSGELELVAVTPSDASPGRV